MIRTQWAFVVALAAANLSAAAGEPETAGRVKTARGSVSIERSGETLAAGVGTPVLAADRVRTGEDGSVGITLKDNTLLSAGPNTVLVLDRFIFDSTTHGGQLVGTVKRGTLAVVTGKLARQAAESVEIHTPTSILGVRGTEFVVEVVGGTED